MKTLSFNWSLEIFQMLFNSLKIKQTILWWIEKKSNLETTVPINKEKVSKTDGTAVVENFLEVMVHLQKSCKM